MEGVGVQGAGLQGGRQRVGGTRPGRVWASVQVVLGVYWLLDARFGDGGLVTLALGLGWLLSGLATLALAPTTLTDGGVRPTMRLRRVPWDRVARAYTSRSRPGSLALQVDGERRPVWVADRAGTVARRYTAATGRTVSAYGLPLDPGTPAPQVS